MSLRQNHETYKVKWNLGDGFAKVMRIVDKLWRENPKNFLRNYHVYMSNAI